MNCIVTPQLLQVKKDRNIILVNGCCPDMKLVVGLGFIFLM
jgi:hypothetical protein